MRDKRYILPIYYHAGELGINQWFQLFTLCLAPLALHLAAGIPEPTVLKGREPGWWDRLPFFNPVSILWRYHAVADRRLRATNWDELDMAASNAAFWNGNRWDGSEDVLLRSRAWITKKPASSHVALLSASTLSTVGLTLQGVQAVVYISRESPEALDMAFAYLALLSLFRLTAAFWLSSDYGFVHEACVSKPGQAGPSHSQWFASATREAPLLQLKTEPSRVGDCPRLHSTESWIGIVVRTLWATALFALFLATFAVITQGIVWERRIPLSTTAAVERVFYALIAFGSFIIHGYYLLRGANTTTIIPCIHRGWYKIYTLILFVSASLVIIISSLETHTCWHEGYPFYTTFPCDIVKPPPGPPI